MLDLHCPVATGSQVWFAQPDALRGSLVQTLKDVRPTVFFGVPRVWEKIYEKMQEVAKSTKGLKKTIGAWAKAKATAKNESLQYGSSAGKPFMFFVAKAILNKIRQQLGLDKCIACFTGAAPIEMKVLKYFASIDIPILELFGQSECTGPHTVNIPTAWKLGSCGRPLPGTESKIDPNTGEICYRGRHIFMGYMYMHDKTVETIDNEGWLHSGDVGRFDDDKHPDIPGESGFMYITGRIKELIITAGGENIPPVLIEQEFKLAMPALSNCMVVGDKRKFLTIILTLIVEVDLDTGIPSKKLTGESLETAKRIGSKATTTTEAMTCPKFEEYFTKGMEVANAKSTSRAQRVSKWALVESDFSEPTGELTPTLKLKRSEACKNHSAVIESMYA
jgi:long-chain-fatty-acid--CoA ligase ACSBG